MLLYFLLSLQLKYTAKGLEAIVHIAENNVRQAVNNLQSTFQEFGNVTWDSVHEVSQVDFKFG